MTEQPWQLFENKMFLKSKETLCTILLIMVKKPVILRLQPVSISVSNSKERAIFDHILHTGHNSNFDGFETPVKE